MRKIFGILVFSLVALIISSQNTSAQTGPVYKYTHPSLETLKDLCFQTTPKGVAYRNYLINAVNVGLRDTLTITEDNLSWVFDHLHDEEVYLEEGVYMNSGWNPSSNKMVPSVGHKWTGFAWVLRVGSYVLILTKKDCGNILKYPVKRIVVEKKQFRSDVYVSPTFDYTKKESNSYVPPTTNQVLIPEIVPVSKKRTWVGRNLVWLIPTAAALVGGGIYLANQHQDAVVEIEIRSMPPAIPSQNTVGVPSDPRGMPNGTTGMKLPSGGLPIFRF